MNLTPEQYTKAFELFPGLEAYMTRCSFIDWMKNRLAELCQYKADNFGDF